MASCVTGCHRELGWDERHPENVLNGSYPAGPGGPILTLARLELARAATRGSPEV